ncbi:MAG: redoxin domain-containing protein [Bacteroidota bacterium]|nr:redoxin domain-containing protein [Bacteroidota bacterium]
MNGEVAYIGVNTNVASNIMKPLLFTTFTFLTISSFGQKVLRKPVKVIPQISIYNINGDTTNLKKVSDNKVTFIDFWFIPCGPCFVEMNMLHKLYAKYKDNPNVAFLTITLTDSAFVRPLIENRNTTTNDTYDYFKTLALLDTFKLPVYFLKDVASTMTSFKKEKIGFSGHGESKTKQINYSQYPDNIFGFSGYPTIFIFDKEGNRIYSKTGFTKNGEKKQQKNIEVLINAKL